MKSLAMKVACITLLCAFNGACDPGSPQTYADATRASAAAESAARPDTSFDANILALLAQDSALSDSARYALIDRLEPVADQATNKDSAALALIRLGWLKLRLYSVQPPEDELARRPDLLYTIGAVPDSVALRRSKDFQFDPSLGQYLYVDHDFERAQHQYAQNHWIIDDADWGRTFTSRKTSCAALDCELQEVVGPAVAFLSRHPASPYAGAAIQRINIGLAAVTQARARRNSSRIESAVLDDLMESYARALVSMPRDVAAEAVPIVGNYKERLGQGLSARALYQWAIAEGAATSPDSLRVRIEQLPGIKGFMAAALRDDGIVVPFAVFDDKRWAAPWLRPKKREDGLAEMLYPWFDPGRREWFYWPDDDTRRVITSAKTVSVDNHCQVNWGMATDFPGKVLPRGEHHENLGVVLDVDHKVQPPVTVPDSSAEALALKALLRPAFVKAENENIARSDSTAVARRLPPAAERAKVSIAVGITRLNAASGQVLYAFVASREYPTADRYCNDESISSGWILRGNNGKRTLITHDHSIDDCSRKGGVTSEPMGALIIDGRTFVFALRHGWEDESYIISELRGGRLLQVFEIWGGGC